jgi:thiol:disulfide interchange protein DsbD
LPPASHKVQTAGVSWQQNLESSLALAKARNRSVLLDFRADWCVACLELEKRTWPDSRVQTVLAEVVPVRLDMTQNTAANRELIKRFGVLGLPTVILLNPDGSERDRFVAFKGPEEFLAWYRAASRGAAP